MDVRRLFASTMSEALTLVREQLGDDALILESRSVSGGVEVTAAGERRSPRLLPDDEQPVVSVKHEPPSRGDIERRLGQAGLDAARAAEVAAAIDPASAVESLSYLLPLAPLPLPLERGRFAVIGPPGAGKTTTIAKLIAGHALARGGNDAVLVTLDTVRPAAAEQLRGIAKILSVPVLVARDVGDLERMLKALADRELILIDTPGIAPSSAALEAAKPWLQRFAAQVSVALVSSATYAYSYQRRVFEMLAPYTDIVVGTHLDDALSVGELLACAWDAQRPVAWLGNGPDVPDDLQRVDRLALAARLLGQDFADAATETALAARSRHLGAVA